MLKNIDINKFAEKIKETSGGAINESAINYAKSYISIIDEILEPAVLAWIEGKEIPNIVYGDCSVHEILAYRPDIDFKYAMRIFSMYIEEYEDPEEAELLLNYRLRRKCVWFRK